MSTFKSLGSMGLGTVVIGIGTLSFILGPERVSRETRAAAQRIENAIDQSLSNEQLLASARMELADQEKLAAKQEEKLYDVEERIATSQGAINYLKNEIAQHDSALRLGKLKLVSQSDVFEINGRTVTRSDIEKDVDKRLEHHRDATSKLADQEDTQRQLDEIKSEALANLEEVRTTCQAKARELDLLAARIKNAEVQEQLRELRQKYESTAGDKTKYEQTVAELKRRIDGAEREAKRLTHKSSDLIDWTSPSQRDFVAEIDAQLKLSPPTPAVAKN